MWTAASGPCLPEEGTVVHTVLLEDYHPGCNSIRQGLILPNLHSCKTCAFASKPWISQRKLSRRSESRELETFCPRISWRLWLDCQETCSSEKRCLPIRRDLHTRSFGSVNLKIVTNCPASSPRRRKTEDRCNLYRRPPARPAPSSSLHLSIPLSRRLLRETKMRSVIVNTMARMVAAWMDIGYSWQCADEMMICPLHVLSRTSTNVFSSRLPAIISTCPRLISTFHSVEEDEVPWPTSNCDDAGREDQSVDMLEGAHVPDLTFDASLKKSAVSRRNKCVVVRIVLASPTPILSFSPFGTLENLHKTKTRRDVVCSRSGRTAHRTMSCLERSARGSRRRDLQYKRSPTKSGSRDLGALGYEDVQPRFGDGCSYAPLTLI
ncbi:hypothetical protein B0H16DRAFT_1896110 [Mycena metata]|uniref:Uncharacterized protein n=1 Tax=Mycena metata TaxID=1033252 RepID=A0AAD7HK02_9AGAR|nr:hypothetical protein B0H16DRAFT_1896110 [Mycena metata]